MKIQIAPEQLKPGQHFDVTPLFGQGVPLSDMTFLGAHGTSLRVEDPENRRGLMTPQLYNFFIEVSHEELVRALVKPGEQIKAEVTPKEMHLLHMIVGLCGEAGELLDALKKAIIYRKPLDHTNVVEELGDLEFYLEGIRQGMNITREDTLDANIAKLSKRYERLNYSNQAAVDRADKNVENAIINLRSNPWFTEAHAERLRGVKDLEVNKLIGLKSEETFNRWFPAKAPPFTKEQLEKMKIENCHADGRCMTPGEALQQIRDGKYHIDQ